MKNSIHISFRIALVFILALILNSCDKSDTENEVDQYIISSPQANETVLTGIQFQVKWHAPEFLYVDIELYKGSDFVYAIETRIDVRSGYNWMPNENLSEGTDYYLKVSNSDNKSQYAINKQSFSIKKHHKEFSEFTDPLDGRVYKTTKIGDQWWMAENYSYDSEEDSFWFEWDRQQYESYGKMYTFEKALECAPPGWHLPTNDEWEELSNYFGNSIVVALEVGGGSGFDAFPAGAYTIVSGTEFFAHASRETRYCTSTLDDGSPVIRVLSWPDNNFTYYSGGGTYVGTYVRYIKD